MATVIAAVVTGVFGVIIAWIGRRTGQAIADAKQASSDIKRQTQRIDALAFLTAHLLTGPEATHLTKIDARKDFDVDSKNPVFWAEFRDEIRRLHNLGFIAYHRDRDGKDLFDQNGADRRNVLNYCDTQEAGRNYLALRAETGVT